ncbi:MAG: S-layer homology domain-containing protein [Candidatus Gracilibacteria bacterium]|jgi:hypothetical protein|nr:S-layer homology domain-containing protein [Candidatus Gracilibacteria bacterium]
MKKTLIPIFFVIFLLHGFSAFAAISPTNTTVQINSTTVNGPILSDGDGLGTSIAPLGDFDGDGVPDIMVGLYADDTGGSNRGAVELMFMNADGSVKSTTEFNTLTPNGAVLNDNDFYGVGLANLGDLDGDGVIDIAVSTWSRDAGGLNRGGFFIHFLNADATIKSTVEINGLTPNGPTLVNSDTYGLSVARLGDLDGDGVTEILAGATGDDTGGTGRGAVYIHFMNSNGTIKSTVKLTSLTPNGATLSNLGGYGRSVSSLGDLDGDGVLDIAVGADSEDFGGTDRGAVFIHFLNTNGSIKSTSRIDFATVNGPTLVNSDRYGAQVRALGDLDSDGFTELAVGAVYDDTGGTNRGAAYIHSLKTDGTLNSTIKISSATTNGPILADTHYYGLAISDIGDLNGDGIVDIAGGTYGNDTGGTDRGAIHIHFLNSFIRPPAPTVLTPPSLSTVYNNQNPTFTGTGNEAGNTITIKDGLTLIGTGTVLADLSWSITSVPVLPYATYNFSVYETKVWDGPSTAHTITLASDLIPPANPLIAPDLLASSDLGVSNTDDITADNTPDFDVNCTEIGSKINLYSDNPAPSTLIATHTCTAISTEQISVSVAISDGVHNITYEEEDPAGNKSLASPSLAITIDTSLPPAISIVSVGGDATSPYSTTSTLPEIIINSNINDTFSIPGYTCTPTPATGATVSCTKNAPAYAQPSSNTETVSLFGLAGNGPTTLSLSFNVVLPPSGGGGVVWPLPEKEKEPEASQEIAPEEDEITEVIVLPEDSCLVLNETPKIFSDLENHPLREEILSFSDLRLGDQPLLKGYAPDLFLPDQSITRAEFLKLALLTNCISFEENFSGEKEFLDIPIDSDFWYTKFVYTAYYKGIIEGYADGNFYPNSPITKAEALKILVQIKSPLDKNSIISLENWYSAYVSVAFNLSIISNDPSFDPASVLSRAEAVSMMKATLK